MSSLLRSGTEMTLRIDRSLSSRMRTQSACPCALCGRAAGEPVEVLQGEARADRDAGQRRLDDRGRDLGLGLDEVSQTTQQRAAASQQDAVAGDVAGKLGRGVLERFGDRREDLAQRRAQGLANL